MKTRIILLAAFLFACMGCATFNVADPSGLLTSRGPDPTVSTVPRKLGAVLLPQQAGDFWVNQTASSPLAIKDGSSVTRDTFETAHGRITAGGGGSDFKIISGPLSGAETTDAAIHLLANGDTANNANWIVDYGAACQNLTTHLGSVCINGRGNLSNYGDVVFTNANGNANTLEVLGKFDGASGDLVPFFNISWLGKSGNIWTQSSGKTLTLGADTAIGVIMLSANGAAGTGNASFIGSTQYTTRTVTSSFTVDTTTTDRTIWANTSGGAITVTLPAPTVGRELIFVDSAHSWATNHLTIARHGSETINTVAANLSVVAGSGVSGVDEICRVVSDGTNWQSDCK